MNKTEMIAAIADKAGLTKKDLQRRTLRRLSRLSQIQ